MKLKRTSLLLSLILFLACPLSAQGPIASLAVLNSSTQDGPVINLLGAGVSFHQFTWNTTGTVSAGSCALLGSADNVTYGTTVIAAQVVTSTGGPTAVTAGVHNYVKISCTTPIMGSGTVRVRYFGTTLAAGGANALGANGQIAFFTGVKSLSSNSGLTTDQSGSLTATGLITGGTVTSTGLLTAGSMSLFGQLTSVQGTLSGASTPAWNHTATWNNGATEFVDDNRAITATASTAASSLAKWQVGGSTVFRVRKDGSMSDTDTFGFTGINITSGRHLGLTGGTQSLRLVTNGTTGNFVFNNSSAYTSQASTVPFMVYTAGSYTANTGSGVFPVHSTTYTLNFSGAQSGSVTGYFLNATETALNSVTHNLMDLQTGSASKFRVSNAGRTIPTLYGSQTNCADSAGAAACAAAPTGAVVMTQGGTTVTVSTTAVTANSRIFIQEDPSLATELGITCNTTVVRTYAVTARTAATSFVITSSAAPVTDDACLNYWIVN